MVVAVFVRVYGVVRVVAVVGGSAVVCLQTTQGMYLCTDIHLFEYNCMYLLTRLLGVFDCLVRLFATTGY